MITIEIGPHLQTILEGFGVLGCIALIIFAYRKM